MADSLELIHKAFIDFTKRAEKSSADILKNTFVDSEPLFHLLATNNNQVMYGRRGTGKTHALKYLSSHLSGLGKIPIYVDLRSIGSGGALYHDVSKPISERSVRLILDVLSAVGDELYEIAVEQISDTLHPDQITNRLDDFGNAISDVSVIGDSKVEATISHQCIENSSANLGARMCASGAEIGTNVSVSRDDSSSRTAGVQVSGRERFHIEFGRVQGSLQSLLDVLGNPEIWILVDEWSEVPLELQPYLADLLRRTLLPIDNFIVKIAAIEHRSRFSIERDGGGYIGLELGADLSADLNIDDFLVFDNDQLKAVDFFKSLLFRHYKSSQPASNVSKPDELIKLVFTQGLVFDEFVRAVEGVPRDALNLASKAVTKAFGKQITISDVRAAARDWYQQDKAAPVRASEALERILGHLIDRVIGERRARAFLFPANVRNEFIDRLFDARILHLLKKNISSHDEAGKRYDVFKIDYGCYVDLINTVKAPRGLFETEEEIFVDVPSDDYRSIRRAILRPSDLDAFASSAA